jgi:hypothetical protein
LSISFHQTIHNIEKNHTFAKPFLLPKINIKKPIKAPTIIIGFDFNTSAAFHNFPLNVFGVQLLSVDCSNAFIRLPSIHISFILFFTFSSFCLSNSASFL